MCLSHFGKARIISRTGFVAIDYLRAMRQKTICPEVLTQYHFIVL